MIRMDSLLAFIGNLGTWEILIIVFVIVLLFGSAKIPQLMRGFGSGINEFKKGLKEGEKEASADKDAEKKDAASAPPAESEKK